MTGTRRNETKNYLTGALLLALLGVATLAQATDLDERHAWSVAGSTGAIDQRDVGEVMLRGVLARFDPAADDGSAKIRYNVSATDALVGSMRDEDHWQLEIAFRDTGVNDRVRVYLKETPLDGRPQSATLIAFDSDDLDDAASNAARMESVEVAGVSLDFERNIYTLEVLLNKYGETIGATFNGAVLQPVRAAE